jgi:hypothetical protein
MKVIVIFLCVSLRLLAQEPELRGTVTETGSNLPLAAVEITVSEFVPVDHELKRQKIGTVFTNSNGLYQFRPGHLGEYWIEAKLDGYSGGQMLLVSRLVPAEGRSDFDVREPHSNARFRASAARPHHGSHGG